MTKLIRIKYFPLNNILKILQLKEKKKHEKHNVRILIYLKGLSSSVLRDPPLEEEHTRFTTVPWKPKFDQ